MPVDSGLDCVTCRFETTVEERQAFRDRFPPGAYWQGTFIVEGKSLCWEHAEERVRAKQEGNNG